MQELAMVEQYNEIVRKCFNNKHEADKYCNSPEYNLHMKMIGEIELNAFTGNHDIATLVDAFLIVNYKPLVQIRIKYLIETDADFATLWLHYDAGAFDVFFENQILSQNEIPLHTTVRPYVLARRGYWHNTSTCYTFARLMNKEFAHMSFINYPPYRDFCKQYQLQKRASISIIHETQCGDFARSCVELVFADEYIVGKILDFF